MGRYSRKLADGELVQCQECVRLCHLEEMDFESLAEAQKGSFACRLYEELGDGFRKIEEKWETSVEKVKGELEEGREKQVELEALVGESVRRGECELRLQELAKECERKVLTLQSFWELL